MITPERRASVTEVPDSGEKHGDPEAVGSVNHFLVADRASRLNDRGDAVLCDFLESVGEREEGIGTDHGPFQRQNRLLRADPRGIASAGAWLGSGASSAPAGRG